MYHSKLRDVISYWCPGFQWLMIAREAQGKNEGPSDILNERYAPRCLTTCLALGIGGRLDFDICFSEKSKKSFVITFHFQRMCFKCFMAPIGLQIILENRCNSVQHCQIQYIPWIIHMVSVCVVLWWLYFRDLFRYIFRYESLLMMWVICLYLTTTEHIQARPVSTILGMYTVYTWNASFPAHVANPTSHHHKTTTRKTKNSLYIT